MNADEPAAPAPAFPDVVKDHWLGVYRFLQSMTGNVHDTEDLTQETFLRALKRYATFQPGTRLRAWLLRIAANAYFDLRRRRQRSPIKPLEHDPVVEPKSPDYALETAEQAALVRAALEELSDLTRMVFHLRVQEDLSFKEIAELAGTTEQAARWHMHQARMRLLKRLEESS